MLASILGYFFYIVATFTVVMALLIGAFDHSTLVKVSRYPRPVIEPAAAAANAEPRNLPIAAKIKQPSAEFASRAISDAGPDAENLARERHVLEKSADRRDNYEGRDYAAGPGYARDFGYNAGLETQR